MRINVTNDDELMYEYAPSHKGSKRANMTLGTWKQRFLKIYEAELNLSQSLWAMHTSFKTYYDICDNDDDFREAVDMIRTGTISQIESKVVELCKQGDPKLLMWYLGKLDPDRFSSEVRINGNGQGTIEFRLNLDSE